MRLNTTTMVNNNTPNDLISNTFKIIQYQNKSLQESLRTSSIHHHQHNHHNHYGGSCRSHRPRCISVSSQSTLMTSLSKNDVFAPTTYTTVMATTIPSGCTILLDDDLHKENIAARKSPQSLLPPPPPTPTSDTEIHENNDPKLTKKTIPEPIHEKLSNKRNNHNNVSSGNLLDNNNSGINSTTTPTTRNSLKTFEILSEKLPWKARRKKPTPVYFQNINGSGSGSGSGSATSTSSIKGNLNNNLHNGKKSNIVIELSNDSSTTSKEADEEDVLITERKDTTVNMVSVEGETGESLPV